MRFRRPAVHEHAGLTGPDLVQLEREKARQIHEGWVHRPQFIGVLALGVIGGACVVGIFIVALHAGSKGSEVATAVSVLGSIASAAVGGIAGMLTGRSGADPRHPTPGAGTAGEEHADQPVGASEESGGT